MRYIDHFGLSPQDTVINADIPPVLITAKGNENEITGMSLWLSSISLGVTINHKYFHDTAKKGLYIGSYKGIKKQYSNKFYGNKQLSKAMVAAQKAKFAKKLKFLTKLKGVFTTLGAADLLEKTKVVYNKYTSGEDPSFEEVYSLVSAAVGLAGLQGAIISLSADLQLLSTQNALNTLEATGDQELFIKTIQPGPRNF